MDKSKCLLRPIQFGLSLGSFLVVVYVGCLLLAIIVPEGGLHRPWLQFFVGFSWTPIGIAIGAIESFFYGLISGIIFAPIANFFGIVSEA